MNDIFVLDACALIALLAGEPGGDNVKKIIQDAVDGNVNVKINQINLLEVEAVPKLQFWNSNLRFNRKSGPDFSPIRPIFLRACSIANKVCAPCALAHSRLVLEQAQSIIIYVMYMIRMVRIKH